MNIQDSRIVLLGANGGIGSALARELSYKGARLLLAGLGQQDLTRLAEGLPNTAHGVHADICRSEDREHLLDLAETHLGGIDVLINAVGIMDFLPLEALSPERIEATLRVNVLAPILFIQAALPKMKRAGRGRIVNIGSIFGSIAFPYFSVYSASKFALRGFSEALRRELQDSGIGVSYVAPRATRTTLNDSRVMAMGKATNMKMDAPEAVAQQIVRAIEKDRDEVYLGRAESLFVRINQLFPWLVDRALRGQRRIMESYAYP